jgi:hypothetical protein
MKKSISLILIMVAVLSPIMADESSGFFDCEELYQQGSSNAQRSCTGSGWWALSGFLITSASTLIAIGSIDDTWAANSDDPLKDLFTRAMVGTGIGLGFSMLLPAMIPASPPSTVPYENAEAIKCYTDGYMHRARTKNLTASFLGSLGGASATAVAGAIIIGEMVAGVYLFLLMFALL